MSSKKKNFRLRTVRNKNRNKLLPLATTIAYLLFLFHDP